MPQIVANANHPQTIPVDQANRRAAHRHAAAKPKRAAEATQKAATDSPAAATLAIVTPASGAVAAGMGCATGGTQMVGDRDNYIGC